MHTSDMGLGSRMAPRSRAVWPVCISDTHLRYGRLGGHIVTRSRAVWPVCISDTHLRYGRLGGHIVTRSRVVSPVCVTDAHLRYVSQLAMGCVTCHACHGCVTDLDPYWVTPWKLLM